MRNVTITFEEACYLIKDLIPQYRVVLRYRSNQVWSFKFERGSNQYDAVDILFMHLHDRDKPDRIDAIWQKVGLSIPDSLALINLASGGWRQAIAWDKRYDNYRRVFTDITGIPIT
jgi:hypothetical protein